MKFHHLCIAISIGAIACSSDDPSASATLGTLSVTPGVDGGSATVPSGSGAVSPGALGGGTQGGGTQGGGAQGGVAGGGGDTGGGSTVCEVKTVGSGRVTPDMLIVLDRSGSMKNGNVNRWDPSVGALKSITASLGSTINFGLMAYPGASMAPPPPPSQDCSALTDFFEQLACIATESAGGIPTVDTCVAGSIDVPIALNNGAPIAAALDRMSPGGATPTAVTLKAAHAAMGSGLSGVDDVAKPKYVLLVTDGAPNCSTPSSTGGGGGGGFDNQAVDQSVAEIAAMAKDGIKTYVIGYNTKSDNQLSAALDRMAQAGGTGDKQHHAIEDGKGLQTEFQKIAGAAASCEFSLNTPPENPKYVEVKLDDQQLNLNDPNGWQISADRRLITLQGSACVALAGMEKHLVSVRVLCNPVMLQ